MINISITDYVTFVAFWLCTARVMTIFIQLPIINNGSIPPMVKILSGLVISYAFFPYVKHPIINDVNYIGVENFWYLTILYTVSGLVIGLLVQLIMQLFLSTGSLMTQQIGFTSVSYFDPTFITNIGPIERIIQYTLVVMILSTGALHPMFKGIVETFYSLSFLKLSKLLTSTAYYIDFFKSLFMTSLLLATPILFSNLLVNIVLGVIARTVPQMNVLMVSFVVNIGVGLLVFFSISFEFFHVAFDIYVKKLGEWFLYIT
jgi:flagellar biosynthetic protein FliR